MGCRTENIQRCTGRRFYKGQHTTEEFTDNTASHRFELQIDDDVAFAVYRRSGDVLLINHVEAPPHLRGTGAAGRLMQGIVDKARADGFKITPICGYAASWLRRNDQYADVVA